MQALGRAAEKDSPELRGMFADVPGGASVVCDLYAVFTVPVEPVERQNEGADGPTVFTVSPGAVWASYRRPVLLPFFPGCAEALD